MIVVVSGGRTVRPDKLELAAFHQALFEWGCLVLRVGCADGVDAAVFRYMLNIPMIGDGPVARRRWWSVERWNADWENITGRMPGKPKLSKGNRYWPTAGVLRTEAMLDGDRSKALSVDVQGTVSVGGAHRLVTWPGGTGTEGAVKAASRRAIDHETIAGLMESFRGSICLA